MPSNDNELVKSLYVKTILEEHGVYYGKELLIEFTSLDEAIDFRVKLKEILDTHTQAELNKRKENHEPINR